MKLSYGSVEVSRRPADRLRKPGIHLWCRSGPYDYPLGLTLAQAIRLAAQLQRLAFKLSEKRRAEKRGKR